MMATMRALLVLSLATVAACSLPGVQAGVDAQGRADAPARDVVADFPSMDASASDAVGKDSGAADVARTDAPDGATSVSDAQADSSLLPDVSLVPDLFTAAVELALPADDFQGALSSAHWGTSSSHGANVNTSNGLLVVEAATSDTPASAGVQGPHFGSVTFVNKAVLVEVVQTLTQDSAAENTLLVQDGKGGTVQMVQTNHNLVFRLASGDAGAVPFDPVLHRWWRIRADSTELYWETSQDGRAWALQLSAPQAGNLVSSAVQVLLSAGTTASVAMPGVAAFDNFDNPPP